MTTLADILRGGDAAPCRPWPRARVGPAAWRLLAEGLGDGRWSLLGLWGDPPHVHMALLDTAARPAIASLACPEGRFPSVGALHAPAIRPERAVRDLAGLLPEGAPDARPWLDHGRWALRAPLGAAEAGPGVRGYDFLPVEGEGLHVVPVGPVHAGIIEPGQFRFTANGETVVRLEARLGWVHKGIEALMRGRDLAAAARLAGRVSGDSTVAYALAFARAAEAARGAEVPERAELLRALMLETERIANHLGDFGAVCNDAAFALIHAHAQALRERVLRAAKAAFGHRLMMDRVFPGGVAEPSDLAPIAAMAEAVGAALPPLERLYDGTASLLDRTVGTGIVRPELARRFAAGGVVGRASGRDFDQRRDLPFPPWDRLVPEVPVGGAGDVDARLRMRLAEIRASLGLVGRLLAALPGAGPAAIALAAGPGEGVALVEGFRGDVLVWLRLDAEGRVARCHLRDPSWFQWPLLEAAIEGNIVADFPLCNKSFNCSYSGHDL